MIFSEVFSEICLCNNAVIPVSPNPKEEEEGEPPPPPPTLLFLGIIGSVFYN